MLPLSQTFKHPGLCGRARKTVQHVTVSTIVLRGSIFDYPNHQIVRYQASGLLNRAHLFSQRRMRLGEGAKDIARGNLRQVEALLQQTRLCAFTGTRRAHQHDNL